MDCEVVGEIIVDMADVIVEAVTILHLIHTTRLFGPVVLVECPRESHSRQIRVVISL